MSISSSSTSTTKSSSKERQTYLVIDLDVLHLDGKLDPLLRVDDSVEDSVHESRRYAQRALLVLLC
jgi:hypothetical protein